ncbi:AAA family ATPase [Kitasatospora sp. MMS16-BH015]|uniref:AAA family ATPase n=1 Tax=Kitasatospora sp. MMS16-BH015 TaxID=2018025 RepID=UPI00131A5A11|nr:AAA family ATPase [Kitasatospora sp. MMS16-BH015]
MAGEQDAVRGEAEHLTDHPESGQRLHERDRELDSATRSLDRLCHEFEAGGTEIGEVLLFSGPAGNGKTSVLDELRRMAGLRRGCTFLSGRGGERQTKEPFHVLRQLLLPVLGGMTEAERAEVFGDWYSIVGPAIGLKPPNDEMEPLDPQGIRDGLTHVITQLAPRRAPLVMVVDDLHWADLESLAWLASFAGQARYLPVLLVFAYRDEFVEEASAHHQQIESQASRKHLLRPLTPESVALCSAGRSSARRPRTCSAVRSGPSPRASRSTPTPCCARSASRAWPRSRTPPRSCATWPPPPRAWTRPTGRANSGSAPCGSPRPPR